MNTIQILLTNLIQVTSTKKFNKFLNKQMLIKKICEEEIWSDNNKTNFISNLKQIFRDNKVQKKINNILEMNEK
ncbi:hypothetical protein SFLOR_v1c05170 [Spiroplasma floricola 23-6]|uniref:Uncharacterized protein n=1 Tax=Spiroplasma floricola 23-6 TaxID=1336749 RepID=A0A2K8SDP0_9MOLU|nr:hypothetical protein SFLOR_v1c05170 [Spiroplasma floricola 23-6]